MAKLSARGRVELARVSKTFEVNDDNVISRRVTYALMSDKHILKKYDVVFKPTMYNPKPEKHSYGWKDFKKTNVSKELFLESFLKAGYTKE